MFRFEGDETQDSEVTQTNEGRPNSGSIVNQGETEITDQQRSNHKFDNGDGNSTENRSSQGSNPNKRTGDDNSGNYGLEIMDIEDAGDMDIVVVHGLHGNRSYSWRPRNAPEKYMPAQLYGTNARCLNYGYDVLKTGSGVYFRNGISKEASRLLQDLARARESLYQVHLREYLDARRPLHPRNIFRPIVFLAHDIGGSIVKHALYQAGLDPRYHEILSCTKLLILFGCPQRCINVQDMEDKLTRLVLCGSKKPLNNILRGIKCLTSSVIQANHFFVESKIQLRAKVVAIISEDKDLARRIFDPYDVKTDMKHGENLGIPEPHLRLTSASDDSRMWTELGRLVSYLRSELASDNSFLGLAVSLSPPMVLLARTYLNDEDFQWLMRNDKFRAWRNNPLPDILIIDGASTTSRHISKSVLRAIRRGPRSAAYEVYFSFDKTDSCRNNTYSFLASSVAQSITHWTTRPYNEPLYAVWISEFSRFVNQRSLADWDLLSLLINLRASGPPGETVFVLDNVEECRDLSHLFWIHMARIFEICESPWKFILVTRSCEGLSDEWLMRWPCLHLDDEMEMPLDPDPITKATLETALLEMIEMDNPSGSLVEQLRTELIDRNAQQGGLALFKLQQCRRAAVLPDKTSVLQFLNTPIEALLEGTLSNVPEMKRPFVAAAISWVTYAFRPLSIQEFVSAIITSNLDRSAPLGEISGTLEPAGAYIVSEVNTLLPGILALDYEVCFQHPQLRDFFLSAENTWYDINRTAHKLIAETCLHYLASSQCHVSLSCLCTVLHGILSTPTFKPKDDLAVYAAENWVRHYNLSPKSKDLTGLAEQFFQDKTAVRTWEQACWFTTNPVTRTDRCYVSIIPLIASTGIEDIFDSYSNDEPSRQALIEATRNGHHQKAQQLLDAIEIDNATAEATLLAASSHGDEPFLTHLISRFHSLTAFTLPPPLLSRAAWLGQHQLVQLLLDHGIALPTASNHHHHLFGETPLHSASRHGHLEIAQLLLAHNPRLASIPSEHLSDNNTGLDVDPAPLPHGAYPLHLAAAGGHAALVQLLLDHGADKDAWTERMGRPLAAACSRGMHAAARALLDAGAEVNYKGRTMAPLASAAEKGFGGCVRLLLERGADVAAVSSSFDGRPALSLAVENRHAAVCRMLLERGADARYWSRGRGAVLGVAAVNKDLETVKVLVEHGADVDGRAGDELLGTPLFQASFIRGSVEVVRYLLDHGADANAASSAYGTVPLWNAVVVGDVDVVRLLLDRGADANVKLRDGWTPLHAAFQNAAMTQMLLDTGATVDNNHFDDNGYSALLLATRHNHPEVLQVLLQHDNSHVDLPHRIHDDEYTLPDDTPTTALYWAVRSGHVRAARILLEAGADVNYHVDRASVVHAAAEDGGEAMLRLLLEFRPDLAVRAAPYGDTALHSAGLPLECARILVNAGVDVHGVNDQGWTPLCYAVNCGNIDVARFLLDKGARVDVVTKGDGSPLHLACTMGSVDAVKILVEAGADVERNYPDVGTPLYVACARWTMTKAWVVNPSASSEREDRRSREIVEYLVGSDGGEEKKKADVNQPSGGDFGFALSAACAVGAVATVDVLLRAGARVDVQDAFGRYPVHLAAYASVEKFERMCRTDADLHCLDKSGRNVLHVAVQGGNAALVERVLAVTPDLLNSADCHGWTPLHYAARGNYAYPWRDRLEWSEEVIRMLLDKGADLWATTKGDDEQKWSPLKLARYHGAHEAALEMFTPMEKTGKDGKQWDEKEHQSLRANRTMKHCNCCLFNIQGLRYKCQRCEDFDLCYKCNRLAAMLHPGHKFEEIGPEFEWEKSRSSDHDTSGEETDGEDESEEDEDKEDSEEESVEN